MSTTKHQKRPLSQKSIVSKSSEIKTGLREKESFDFIFSPHNSLRFFLGANKKVYIVGLLTETRLIADSYQDLPEGTYEATSEGRIYLTTRDNIKRIFWLASKNDMLKILNTPEKELTPPEKIMRKELEQMFGDFS